MDLNGARELLEKNGYLVLKQSGKNTQKERHYFQLTYHEVQESRKLTQQQKILWLCNRFGFVTESMAYDCFRISQFHTRRTELEKSDKMPKGKIFISKWNKLIQQNEYRLVKENINEI